MLRVKWVEFSNVFFVTIFNIEESNMLVIISMFGFSHHIIKVSTFSRESHDIIHLTMCARWAWEELKFYSKYTMFIMSAKHYIGIHAKKLIRSSVLILLKCNG